MDIQKIIEEKLSSAINEKLDEIVTKNVEKSVESIISDLFGTWGSATKQVKEILEKGLQISLTPAKIESYNVRVTKHIEDAIGKYLDERVKDKIMQGIQESASYITKDNWKMSEIVNEFIESLDDSDYADGYIEPTIIIEQSSWGSIYIGIDKENGKREHDCEYRLSVNKDGSVYGFDQRDYANRKMKHESIHGDFDKLIFSLYANKATIEFDDYETEFYLEGYN